MTPEKHLIRLHVRGDLSFGPGKAELLEKIRDLGSLQDAAGAMGMSYSKAWKLVKSMNFAFREPVVILHRGGKDQGGAELTKSGATIMELYRKAVAAAEKAAQPSLEKMRSMLGND
ncbi:winged helix-turn-helix domain-containing protein [Luteolibacter sp. Populi]|uniref:winged helix-turn-helix domain-containing protein n=1 Tax=Luteolibacter sp. Populi TaxID=3230487 RepID=UPI0034657615